MPRVLRDEPFQLARVLTVQELTCDLLPQLLRLLPSSILHPRKCAQLCLFQEKHGAQTDTTVPDQDGIPGGWLRGEGGKEKGWGGLCVVVMKECRRESDLSVV